MRKEEALWVGDRGGRGGSGRGESFIIHVSKYIQKGTELQNWRIPRVREEGCYIQHTCHTNGKFLTFRIARITAITRHVPPGAERPVVLATEARIDGTEPAAIARPAAKMDVIAGRRRAAAIMDSSILESAQN